MKKVNELDKGLTDGWKEDIDSLLVFVRHELYDTPSVSSHLHVRLAYSPP